MAVEGFIVNPASVSPAEIKSDIRTYLESAPDALKWKDFFATGAGVTLIDLVAALGALISYNVVVGRRENYLPYVQNKSSALGISQTLGYSAFRGRNQILALTILPAVTQLISKYTVIGTVKDQDLILLEDTAFNAGTPVVVKVAIGTLVEEELSVTTSGPASFRFSTSGVSQDIRVFLNNVEVATSDKILDLINEKFAVQSNVDGSVNVLYLNIDTFTTQYVIGDTIKIQYIVLKSIAFTDDEVGLDVGTLQSFVVDSLFKSAESLESVKVNAPLFSETQFIIRGRDDYMKTFKLLNTDINSTDYTDISAALVDLCYARKNGCLFTPVELDQYITQLSLFRPMGLVPPVISQPTIVFIDLAVLVKQLNASGNATLEVGTIMRKLEKLLKKQLSFADIEQSIEALAFVKIARITVVTTPWAASTRYRTGKHVTKTPDNGRIYAVHDFVYKTGATEPTWPNTYPLGQQVSDGRIIWCMVDKNGYCPPKIPTTWTANTRFKKGALVEPTVPFTLPNPEPLGPPIEIAFEACRFVNKSKANTPAVFAANSYTGATVADATYDGVFFYACFPGVNGNLITLVFDNVQTVQQVVDAWNLANPSNCVNFYPPSAATQVPPAGTFQLGGGSATSSLSFTALVAGAIGNNITLLFDGRRTIAQVIADYNVAHPGNTLTSSGSAQVLPNGTSITLIGGIDLISGEPVWPGSLLPSC